MKSEGETISEGVKSGTGTAVVVGWCQCPFLFFELCDQNWAMNKNEMIVTCV